MDRLKNLKYSIIIPAYKEEEIIGATLDALASYMKHKRYMFNTEVIVVTADSEDKTHEIVKSKAKLFKYFKHIKPGERAGKGRDVKAGMMAAKGKYVLFTDADLATPLNHIEQAFNDLECGADVVIGVRNLNKIHDGTRKFISLSANYITRALIAPKIKDTQCGFKAFRNSVARSIFSDLSVLGWAFDMEVIAIAHARGLKITQLLIDDWAEPKPAHKQLAGDSNLKSSINSLAEAIKISNNRIRGKYRLSSKKSQHKHSVKQHLKH